MLMYMHLITLFRIMNPHQRSIKHQLKRRIYMVSRSVNTKPISFFDDEVVSRHLGDLHDRFVIVPADKASNNVVFICTTYY